MGTCWEKFQKLHGILIAAGLEVDKIILHPDDLKALSEEFYPSTGSSDSKIQDHKIKSATTGYGFVDIGQDVLGVKLEWIA